MDKHSSTSGSVEIILYFINLKNSINYVVCPLNHKPLRSFFLQLNCAEVMDYVLLTNLHSKRIRLNILVDFFLFSYSSLSVAGGQKPHIMREQKLAKVTEYH